MCAVGLLLEQAKFTPGLPIDLQPVAHSYPLTTAPGQNAVFGKGRFARTVRHGVEFGQGFKGFHRRVLGGRVLIDGGHCAAFAGITETELVV